MVLDEVPQPGTLSELDEMHSLGSNSSNRNDANGSEEMANGNHSIFIMEDLDRSKEETQNDHTVVTNHDNDISLQPSRQSLALVELSSVSVLAVDDTQSHNYGGNVSSSGQNKEFGSDKVDGDKGPIDEHNKESSVRVIYNCLPSRSKRKLEELLYQWSEWHAQHFVSTEELANFVESGEETYFPALRVGSGKSPAVSFSVDVPDRKRQRNDSLILNDSSLLYDRGYAVGLSFDEGTTEESVVDLREAPRCFNCGSFNHPLKDCQKPFNRAAVSSARKEFSSKKNLQSGPRGLTRYYQDSPGGKFDGLKPGSLSAETKKVLGLGELDPPPWLNRMRELGYPPGYLEEEQSSGIEIFGDEDSQKVEVRNDIPLEATQSQKKMTIEFPGINAPVPENADLKSWTAPVASGPDNSFHQPDNVRWSHARESPINGPFQSANWLRNHLDAQSSQFGIGLSPPSPHNHINNYHPWESFNLRREPFGYPREQFDPRGVMIPRSPQYGRAGEAGRPPMFHHNNVFGSL